MQAWAYVDDIVLAAAPEHVPLIMQEFEREAAAAGLERRPDKCTWYCPSRLPLDLPPSVGKPSPLGLPVLGSVADGAYATILHASGPAHAAPSDAAAAAYHPPSGPCC